MKNIVYILLISVLLSATACDAKKEHLIVGKTMGTTYHIKVVTGYFKDTGDLHKKIEKRLAEINQSMSTYIKDSEISRFNTLNKMREKFQISHDFMQVMKAGQKMYRLSKGAWDGTVNPLVDLWGFGSSQRQRKIPQIHEIKALLPKIGFNYIEIIEPDFIVKKQASVSLDLNSIAKGYAVDQVAKLMRADGFENYLVEIGGEVYAAGYRKDGKQWRVGINSPRKDARRDEVYKVVSLYNKAFATSGDYRNFFEVNGVRYSHVIDPRNGYPVSNNVVSVSVIADNCTLADGLATAIMVMGAEEGLDLVGRLDRVECLIVVEKSDGNLIDYFSEGFQPE